MEPIDLITPLVGSAGIIASVVTVYRVRKESHSKSASTEVEAAAQENSNWHNFTQTIQNHVNFLETQVEKLREETSALRNDRQYDREHIRILQRQIRAGIGPPPLRPGDPWPEDQIGG